jgi:hypothetical protein
MLNICSVLEAILDFNLTQKLEAHLSMHRSLGVCTVWDQTNCTFEEKSSIILRITYN